MTVTVRSKWKANLSVTLILVLLLGMIPFKLVSVMQDDQVRAVGDNERNIVIAINTYWFNDGNAKLYVADNVNKSWSEPVRTVSNHYLYTLPSDSATIKVARNGSTPGGNYDSPSAWNYSNGINVNKGDFVSITDLGTGSCTYNKITAHKIIRSSSEQGEQALIDSQVFENEDSKKQAADNVKQSNGNYFVGEYNYTGKYITYNSDFYDYHTNEEASGKNLSPDSALSSGYTDPYTALNLKLQAEGISANAYMVDTRFVEIDTTSLSDDDWNRISIYLWDKNGNKSKDIGDGKNIKNIPSLQSNNRILQINVAGLGWPQLFFYREGLDDKQSESIHFYSGHRYKAKWSNNKIVLEDLGSCFNNDTFTNAYTTPLFFGCFWVDDQHDDRYGDRNNNYTNSWLRGYKNFKWLANIAVRNDVNDNNNQRLRTSLTGLVADKTSGDGLSGKLVDKENNLTLPYMNVDWANNNPTLVSRTANVQFPFYQIELSKYKDGSTKLDNTGHLPVYYQFNSRDVPSLFLDTSTSTLYEHSTRVMSQAADQGGSTKGFFPYNLATTTKTNGDKTTTGLLNNLAFGVKYEIPFVLTEDGLIKGIDTTFEFMGDDDVWVFVDGNLLLDMGGGHKDAYGKINFSLANSTASLESTVDLSKGTMTAAAADIDNNIAQGTFPVEKAFRLSNDSYVTKNGVERYDTTKVHTLTMYFMERGMWESDNFIRFNFAKQNVLTVQNRLELEGINPGLVNKTYEAANYDVFDYTLQNTNITVKPGEYSSNGLKDINYTRAIRQQGNLLETYTAMNSVRLQSADDTGLFDYTQPGAVKDTLFERHDLLLTNSDTAPFVVGKTDENGVFGLLYGQDAVLKYQFFSDSTMNVVQNNTLREQTSLGAPNSLENKFTASGGRTVKDYYETKWTLNDYQNNVLGSDLTFKTYENGTAVSDGRIQGSENTKFLFQNQTAMANIGVDLTATYTNKPKVGNLKITKAMVGDANDKYNIFTIKVKFKSIFGQEGVDLEDNLSNVVYKDNNGSDSRLTASGNISLFPGETVTIENIPVGTQVLISEDEVNNFELVSITDSSEPTIAVGDNNVTVNNRRKTGELILNKEFPADQQDELTDEDKNYEFTYEVRLRAANDFNLAQYGNIIRNNDLSSVINWTYSESNKTMTADVKVSVNQPVKIINIPYGTTATVTEKDTFDTAKYEKVNDLSTGREVIDSPSQSVTLRNSKKPEVVTTSIEVTKKSSGGNKPPIPGAEFELYGSINDLMLRQNQVVAGVKSRDGTKFTFSGLELNHTYYLYEATVPAGFKEPFSRMTEVHTNDSAEVKKVEIFNDPVIIKMPETGAQNTPMNLTFVGIFVIALSGAAMIIYKRKLQRAAVNTEDRGRRED